MILSQWTYSIEKTISSLGREISTNLHRHTYTWFILSIILWEYLRLTSFAKSEVFIIFHNEVRVSSFESCHIKLRWCNN